MYINGDVIYVEVLGTERVINITRFEEVLRIVEANNLKTAWEVAGALKMRYPGMTNTITYAMAAKEWFGWAK